MQQFGAFIIWLCIDAVVFERGRWVSRSKKIKVFTDYGITCTHAEALTTEHRVKCTEYDDRENYSYEFSPDKVYLR